jgi:predicted nucleotidyltransferase
VIGTDRQKAIVEAGVRWAERDPRVRALLLKGSLARGDADERSDVDFVVVAQPGLLQELWAARHTIADRFSGCSGPDAAPRPLGEWTSAAGFSCGRLP